MKLKKKLVSISDTNIRLKQYFTIRDYAYEPRRVKEIPMTYIDSACLSLFSIQIVINDGGSFNKKVNVKKWSCLQYLSSHFSGCIITFLPEKSPIA